MAETYPLRIAAQKLNVRPQFILDFVKSGHLTMVNGKITEESLDDLQWTAALHMAAKAA